MKTKQELKEESNKIFDKLDEEQRILFKKKNNLLTMEDIANYLYQYKLEWEKVKKYTTEES